MAAKPLADLDRAWGTGFMKPDAFLQIVYRDLSQPPPSPLPDPFHDDHHH